MPFSQVAPDSLCEDGLLQGLLPGDLLSLEDAFRLVEALDADARRTVVQRFVEQLMAPYSSLFGPGLPAGSFNQVRVVIVLTFCCNFAVQVYLIISLKVT